MCPKNYISSTSIQQHFFSVFLWAVKKQFVRSCMSICCDACNQANRTVLKYVVHISFLFHSIRQEVNCWNLHIEQFRLEARSMQSVKCMCFDGNRYKWLSINIFYNSIRSVRCFQIIHSVPFQYFALSSLCKWMSVRSADRTLPFYGPDYRLFFSNAKEITARHKLPEHRSGSLAKF